MEEVIRDYYYRHVRIPYSEFLMKRRCHIMDTDATIDYILQWHCSVSRFGDGEFFVMDGGSQGFQTYDERLAAKLQEVLDNPVENHLSCLPICFIKSSMMLERAQRFWQYFVAIHYKMLLRHIRKGYTYGDAQITRFYIDYIDKSMSERRFNRIKSLWDGRDVIIIEGGKTRSGVGNDIFQNAHSIKRILGPAENAFSKYDELLLSVRNHASKENLILISLGLTATVMAYDLAKLGYWAIDLGHLDVEYEWMKMGATEKIPLPYRYVNEASEKGGNIVDECTDSNYLSEIIDNVVCKSL